MSQDACNHSEAFTHMDGLLYCPTCHAEMPNRNDDPAHLAAVAKIAEHRCCDWTGQPCGRDISEFGGRDAECTCETIAEVLDEHVAAAEMRLLERLERDGLLEGVITAAKARSLLAGPAKEGSQE